MAKIRLSQDLPGKQIRETENFWQLRPGRGNGSVHGTMAWPGDLRYGH